MTSVQLAAEPIAKAEPHGFISDATNYEALLDPVTSTLFDMSHDLCLIKNDSMLYDFRGRCLHGSAHRIDALF